MKKQSDFRSFLGTISGRLGFTSTAALAAVLFLLGSNGNPSAAQDTLGGSVGTEQNTDDNVSADTDVSTSGNAGDCQVSAHASASSTSNGETVTRQSEKSVEGPCGKASAKSSASSSSKSSGTSSNGD
jgi:hypothetical protein